MLFAPQLLRTLRTRNSYSATSVDQLPHMLASYLMFGHQLLVPIPDLDRTGYLLALGANPLASNGSMMTAPDVRARLRAIQQRGGRVVVVDPRRTETARIADEHLFIRPGTDALFLFAVLHELAAAASAGAPGGVHGRAGARCASWPASSHRSESAGPTGSSRGERLRRIAREFAEAPTAVCYGRVGTSTQAFGGLCQWLINVINVVSGNLDREGGAMFTRPAFDIVGGPKALAVSRGGFGRWKSRVRGLPEFSGELPVAALAEEILTEGRGADPRAGDLRGQPGALHAERRAARQGAGVAGLHGVDRPVPQRDDAARAPHPAAALAAGAEPLRRRLPRAGGAQHGPLRARAVRAGPRA